MKYHKKSTIVEAEQFFSSRRVPPFYYDGNPIQFHESCGEGDACNLCGQFYIRTLKGPHIVTEGDWIIKDVRYNGENTYQVIKEAENEGGE